MPPAPLLALLVACAELFEVYATQLQTTASDHRYILEQVVPGGCVNQGRWRALGERVPVSEKCMRCVCARSGVLCTRRVCAPEPYPMPKGCHTVLPKNACCWELHCPSGVKSLELNPRLEHWQAPPSVTPPIGGVKSLELNPRLENRQAPSSVTPPIDARLKLEKLSRTASEHFENGIQHQDSKLKLTEADLAALEHHAERLKLKKLLGIAAPLEDENPSTIESTTVKSKNLSESEYDKNHSATLLAGRLDGSMLRNNKSEKPNDVIASIVEAIWPKGYDNFKEKPFDPRKYYKLVAKNKTKAAVSSDAAGLVKRGIHDQTHVNFEERLTTPDSVSVRNARPQVCVENGTTYAAGSALGSETACEQCFCLGGSRRCVRPRCLAPPPGCAPRPAPGACCPARYYCTHPTPPPHGTHDCNVDGSLYVEGERVPSAERERRAPCVQCFCLRGEVRCQPLACAPLLLDCTPRLREGECCPHEYQCEHTGNVWQSSFNDSRINDRSLRPTLSTDRTTIGIISKVKRRTDDGIFTKTPVQNETLSTVELTLSTTSTTEKLVRSNFETSTVVDSLESEDLPDQDGLPGITSTTQPENSVRIVINGTINCTAELSSTSLPLNLTANDTERIEMEAQPRIPIISTSDIESHTFNPNDIITDRSVNGEFDDNETFTINVTSSLSTNSSRVTPRPAMSPVSKITRPTDSQPLNISKKTNEFDFDYADPTLPPSLPNLKIIPFVAADAVVDDDSPKEALMYPILEREDKYPVYYPTLEAKVTSFATRREDTYHPTQYPVFTSEKVDTSQYPTMTHDVDIMGSDYPTANNNMLHAHTVSTSLGAHILDMNKAVTKTPSTSTTFELETPVVNLFSPPVETEGGFIPKGPGIIDEYYAVYPSTPSGPSVPHLTTSMQLDTAKECLSPDGQHVPEGTVVDAACSLCTCTWGKVHCTPRPCVAPEGCYYRPADMSPKNDICCGELVCGHEKEATSRTTTTTEKVSENINETTVQSANESNPSVDTIITYQNETKESDIVTKYENKTLTENIKTTITTKSIDKDSHSKDITSTSAVTTTSTEATTTSPSTTSTTAAPEHERNETHFSPPDYEEEEDDEGFSFGSVLKLLLSDSYDTTTASAYKKKPLVATTKAVPSRTTTSSPPSSKPAPKPTVAPFVPMPHHPYVPPKKTFQQNTVNRIDHLVLGEATAIRKPTRPTMSPFKPIGTKPTTQKPPLSTRTTPGKEVATVQPPAAVPGVGGLKLAGCNIYGRMYRVERVIAELSTPCQECRCTELGVQCRALAC